jgi:hypothetical protein
LGNIAAAGRKLASLSLVQGLLRVIPGLPAAALAGVVIMFFAWSCERQARRRDTVQAQQVKKQAAQEISRLQQQAAGALRDAKQSAQAVNELEAQRQKLARQAEGLRQSLASLRQQELARADEVATLPTSEVVSRVASRLQEQVSGVRDQGSGQQPLNPLTRPAPAGESAGAGHPLPQGGEGQNIAGGEGKNIAGGEGQNNPGGAGQKCPGAGIGEKQPAPDTQHLVPNPSSPALALSDQGVRKVEAAFIELDSCRQQTQVLGQQVSNCEHQSKLNSTISNQQSVAIAKLNAVLADKDQILAQSEVAHRAELQAARGTWRSHFLRAVEYFAGGFIAGVLVR